MPPKKTKCDPEKSSSFLYSHDTEYIEPYMKLLKLEDITKSSISSIPSIQYDVCQCTTIEVPWNQISLPQQGTYELKQVEKKVKDVEEVFDQKSVPKDEAGRFGMVTEQITKTLSQESVKEAYEIAEEAVENAPAAPEEETQPPVEESSPEDAPPANEAPPPEEATPAEEPPPVEETPPPEESPPAEDAPPSEEAPATEDTPPDEVPSPEEAPASDDGPPAEETPPPEDAPPAEEPGLPSQENQEEVDKCDSCTCCGDLEEKKKRKARKKKQKSTILPEHFKCTFEEDCQYVEPYLEELEVEYNAEPVVSPCTSKTEIPWTNILIPKNIYIPKAIPKQELMSSRCNCGEPPPPPVEICTCSDTRPIIPISEEVEICTCDYVKPIMEEKCTCEPEPKTEPPKKDDCDCEPEPEPKTCAAAPKLEPPKKEICACTPKPEPKKCAADIEPEPPKQEACNCKPEPKPEPEPPKQDVCNCKPEPEPKKCAADIEPEPPKQEACNCKPEPKPKPEPPKQDVCNCKPESKPEPEPPKQDVCNCKPEPEPEPEPPKQEICNCKQEPEPEPPKKEVCTCKPKPEPEPIKQEVCNCKPEPPPEPEPPKQEGCACPPKLELEQKSCAAIKAKSEISKDGGIAPTPSCECPRNKQTDSKTTIAKKDTSKISRSTSDYKRSKDLVVTIKSGDEVKEFYPAKGPAVHQTGSLALIVEAQKGKNEEIEGFSINIQPNTSLKSMSSGKQLPAKSKSLVSAQAQISTECVSTGNNPRGANSMPSISSNKMCICPSINSRNLTFAQSDTSQQGKLCSALEKTISCICPQDTDTATPGEAVAGSSSIKITISRKAGVDASTSGNIKPNPVVKALESCQAEMKPLRDALNSLKDKIRDLNLPETNAMMRPDSLCTPCGKPRGDKQPTYMTNSARGQSMGYMGNYQQSYMPSYPYSSRPQSYPPQNGYNPMNSYPPQTPDSLGACSCGTDMYPDIPQKLSNTSCCSCASVSSESISSNSRKQRKSSKKSKKNKKSRRSRCSFKESSSTESANNDNEGMTCLFIEVLNEMSKRHPCSCSSKKSRK